MAVNQWSLATPAHHMNDDGSALIVAQLTDALTGNVGTVQLTVDEQGNVKSFVDGNAGLTPLGMWNLQQ